MAEGMRVTGNGLLYLEVRTLSVHLESDLGDSANRTAY